MGNALNVNVVDASWAGDQPPLTLADRSYNIPTGSGLYVAITTTGTSEVVEIPSGATHVLTWFAASAATKDYPTVGRFVFSDDDTPVTGIANGDDTFWYHPASVASWPIPSSATHIHFAGTTDNVVLGGFLF